MKLYYIDPIAGIDTNSGRSFTSAFKTWKKASTVVAQGDIIKLGAGIYSELLEIKTPSITLQAYGNGDVIFSGNNVLPNGTKFGDNIILPSGEVTFGYVATALCHITANYVTLIDIIIENSAGRGIEFTNTDYTTLVNVTVRNTKAHGIAASNCNYINFNNVKVSEASSYAKSWRDATLAKFMAGVYMVNCNNLLVTGITTSNNYGTGIEFKTVSTAELYNIKCDDNYTGILLYGCSTVFFDQLFLYQLNPLFLNKGRGGVCFTNNNSEIGIANAIIANHTINLNVAEPTEDVDINNCTIYSSIPNQYLIRIPKSQTNFIIQNSIIYGEDALVDFSNDYLDTATAYNSNVWYTLTPPTELDSITDILSDPLFLTKTIVSDLNNYKLLDTSPAINSANGNARFGDYLSNAPIATRDIGAIEFIVGTVPLIDPLDDNQILNSTFETDADWTFFTDYEISNDQLHVTSTSINNFFQDGISLTSAQYYEVKFDVFGKPGSTPIKLEIIETGVGTNLGLNELITVSDIPTTYKVKFQASATEVDTSLIFSFSGDYYFDNIYFYPVDPVIQADFSISNINPSLGEIVYFINESISTTQISSIEWDFGFYGGSNVNDTSLFFITPGTVDITLTITTPDGTDSITKSLNVKSVLNPTISVTHTIAKVGETIGFSNIASIVIPIDSYLWDFGDGSKSTESSPTHSYNDAGIYKAILTTTNEGGSATSIEHVIEIIDYDLVPNTTVALELMAVDPTTGFFIRIPPPPNVNYTLVSTENGNLEWMPYRG